MPEDALPPEEINTVLPLAARPSREESPLRSLLNVIAEQFGLLQADLDQVYDDWFITTPRPATMRRVTRAKRTHRGGGYPSDASARSDNTKRLTLGVCETALLRCMGSGSAERRLVALSGKRGSAALASQTGASRM